MRRTLLVHHPFCCEHETGPGHPERPERLLAIGARLQQSGLLASLQCQQAAEAPLLALERVHDPAYIARIEELAATGHFLRLDADTALSPASWRAARLAAGAAIQAVDAVATGRADNAFCAVRPPGHHAERDRAMGFCLFNNVAVAARHLQQVHGIGRVAIVDWDVHHGNGTQHAFEEDPSVFFFSIHQYPHYPGSGAAGEKGLGRGEGYTLNIPVQAGLGDEEYGRLFAERLQPALEAFRPEFVLVSAGFDAHRADPLGGMRLSEAGFAGLTRQVLDLARSHCGGRLVSVLEGGYDLEATAASVEAHLRVLAGV